MQIITLNRYEVSSFRTEKSCMIFSVKDPESDPVFINEFQNLVHVEWLEFWDVSDSRDGAITQSMADKIALVFKKYRDECEIVVVQCEAGVSRSAGIAVAIGEYIGIPYTTLKHSYPLYNRFVYQMVASALRKGGDGHE